jgi:hypothetical protein
MRGRRFLTLAAVTLMSLTVYMTGSDVSSASGPKSKVVTFNKDVAPIFFGKCVNCHQPGAMAPMSLVGYKEARPWARSIKEKVLTREMPPWHADPQYGHFANDRKLSQAEIDTITAWVDQGAKEGDQKDLPPAPALADGWGIGKPDLVLSMQEEYTLAAEGPDEYKYFRIPTNFKQDMWVQAVEARAGNKKIVHHIIAFVTPPPPATPRKAPPLPAAFRDAFMSNLIFYRDGELQRVKADAPVFDDGCSTPLGGSGVFRDGRGDPGTRNFLVGTAPGTEATVFPPGTAKKIPAGSHIVLQIHYSRAGAVEKDRSSIGLKFTSAQPDKVVNTAWVSNHYFKIPAGAENHRVTACFTFPENAHIYSLGPHMHVRGKDMTFTAHYPDGRSEVLISVPRYSFSWQTFYVLSKPLAMPKGTRIECVAHFDNSAKNKYNPDPAKAVRFGEPTYDEMMIGFVDYTLDGQHLARPEAGASAAVKK